MMQLLEKSVTHTLYNTKKKITVLVLVIMVILLLSKLSPSQITASSAGENSDWPMFMHDPQHTGATNAVFSPVWGTSNCKLTIGSSGSSTDVSPCVQARWKKGYLEWPNGLSQPVVVGNTVFQANMDGKLYAYDSETGVERWVFNAGSAIAVTPAIFEEKIYFGDFSGKIYGLNVADKSPVNGFPIQTGGPIYSSPVVFRENNLIKVFIGSNDGKLYTINGDTGQQLFTPFDTGRSYIFSNPAYFSGKIFFAAENMYAYAISSETGAKVWSKKLDGESNRGNHPVVVASSNTVLFHSVPRWGDTGQGLKDRFQLSSGSLRDGVSLESLLTNYQTGVLANPGTKSMYLFDVNTGTEITQFTVGSSTLSLIPVNLWYSNGQNYPLVLNQKDLLIGAHGGYVLLDTVSRSFSVWLTQKPVRGDEYTGVTLADGWLYGGYYANVVRVHNQDKQIEILHGCRNCGDPPPYGVLDEPLAKNIYPDPAHPCYQKRYMCHWQGYTGNGGTDTANYFVVAGGHAYWVSHGWLYAF